MVMNVALVKIGPYAPICSNVSIAENKFLCISFELIPDMLDSFKENIRADLIGQYHRVETPNYGAKSQSIDEHFKRIDTVL
jgi:hypothetical protein